MKFKIIIILGIVILIAGGFFVWKLNFPQGNPVGNEKGLGNAEVQIFQSEDGGFSFSYPKNLKVTETALEGVDGGKRILVESGEVKKGFEITVLPFDEAGPLTRERILADVPDMEMSNVENISVGENISALSFESVDENIGKTFEIWFVSSPQGNPVGTGGYLFEARTYPEFGGEMEEMLNTWSTSKFSIGK